MFWEDVDLKEHYLTQQSRQESMLKQAKLTVQRQRESDCRIGPQKMPAACIRLTGRPAAETLKKDGRACHAVRGNQERVVSGAEKGDGLKQMRRDPQRREGGRLVFNGERVSFL